MVELYKIQTAVLGSQHISNMIYCLPVALDPYSRLVHSGQLSKTATQCPLYNIL